MLKKCYALQCFRKIDKNWTKRWRCLFCWPVYIALSTSQTHGRLQYRHRASAHARLTANTSYWQPLYSRRSWTLEILRITRKSLIHNVNVSSRLREHRLLMSACMSVCMPGMYFPFDPCWRLLPRSGVNISLTKARLEKALPRPAIFAYIETLVAPGEIGAVQAVLLSRLASL